MPNISLSFENIPFYLLIWLVEDMPAELSAKR